MSLRVVSAPSVLQVSHHFLSSPSVYFPEAWVLKEGKLEFQPLRLDSDFWTISAREETLCVCAKSL